MGRRRRCWETGGGGSRRWADGRRECGFDAEGTEAEKKRVHVTGLREGDGAGDSVVAESKTEKLRGDRVGLHLVQGRQGRDKEIEVDFGVILGGGWRKLTGGPTRGLPPVPS